MTPAERSRNLRYKRPALASMGFEAMRDELDMISDKCCDIHWWTDTDDETLLNALDGDEEDAWEFRLAFSELDTACERLNQAIWDEGFTMQTLSELSAIAKEVYNGTTLFERIPQAQQSGLSRGSEILCAAAIICRGCPGTESENREIYRTADLIGDGRIQETFVEEWSRIVGCWFEDARLYLSSIYRHSCF